MIKNQTKPPIGKKTVINQKLSYGNDEPIIESKQTDIRDLYFSKTVVGSIPNVNLNNYASVDFKKTKFEKLNRRERC